MSGITRGSQLRPSSRMASLRFAKDWAKLTTATDRLVRGILRCVPDRLFHFAPVMG
jgi:hypothetical protein